MTACNCGFDDHCASCICGVSSPPETLSAEERATWKSRAERWVKYGIEGDFNHGTGTAILAYESHVAALESRLLTLEAELASCVRVAKTEHEMRLVIEAELSRRTSVAALSSEDTSNGN